MDISGSLDLTTATCGKFTLMHKRRKRGGGCSKASTQKCGDTEVYLRSPQYKFENPIFVP